MKEETERKESDMGGREENLRRKKKMREKM